MNIFRNEVAKRRAGIRLKNREYPKDRMVELPLTEEQKQLGSDGHKRIAAFRSHDFIAQLFETPFPKIMRLSVNRTDIDKAGRWFDGITFDDLYWIKNLCGFQHCDAVEVHPKIEDFVDEHNIRHLFIFSDETFDLPFAWRKPKPKEEENDTTSESAAAADGGAAGAQQPEAAQAKPDAGSDAGGAAVDSPGNILPLRP